MLTIGFGINVFIYDAKKYIRMSPNLGDGRTKTCYRKFADSICLCLNLELYIYYI